MCSEQAIKHCHHKRGLAAACRTVYHSIAVGRKRQCEQELPLILRVVRFTDDCTKRRRIVLHTIPRQKIRKHKLFGKRRHPHRTQTDVFFIGKLRKMRNDAVELFIFAACLCNLGTADHMADLVEQCDRFILLRFDTVGRRIRCTCPCRLPELENLVVSDLQVKPAGLHKRRRIGPLKHIHTVVFLLYF